MIRRLRLISGLVMLAYVTMHLVNHAVSLISLDAMENVLWYIFRTWTNPPAQLLLYSSFLVGLVRITGWPGKLTWCVSAGHGGVRMDATRAADGRRSGDGRSAGAIVGVRHAYVRGRAGDRSGPQCLE